MPFAFQRRRGTTSQHSSFTGLNAELTVDTDKKTVVVHDGSTAGGFFRYSSSVSLNTALPVGDTLTLVWLNTNGATAYYPNTIQIDGTTITGVKWQGGTAVAAGNASSIDAYVFTIIKTASATFTVLASQTKFA